MRTKLLVLAAAGLMAMGTGAASLVGCSGSATSSYHPPASQLKEGVNILDAKDASWGSNTAFVRAGRVVYIETRVGTLKPEVYRQTAPDEPQYEMDMRVVDQNGITFLVVRGGDKIIDPTWSAEIAKTDATNHIPKADRDLDWKLAQEGAKAVAAALPAGFQDHVFHMAHFGAQPTPAEDSLMLAAEAALAKTPPPADQTAYGSYNSGGYSTYWTGKYSGTTGCFFWTCARHSATDMQSCDWNGSGCSWVRRIVANNHGRGPWDSGMGYDCASQGGWQLNTPISGSTAGSATGSWDGQGGCQTGYSWSSNNNAHLCNDDAAYELWEAKFGPQNNINFNVGGAQGASGWGSGYKGFGNFSCNYPSGDYNTPNCP